MTAFDHAGGCSRLLDGLAGRVPLWPTLVGLSAAVFVVQLAGTHATAWHYFEDAADLLLGRAPAGEGTGLRLYRDHPELQFGPVSVVAALPFTLLGDDAGRWAAMLASSAIGLLVVALLLDVVERTVPGWRAGARPTLVLTVGAVVIVTWGDVAVRTAHLDDALALVAIVAGVRWCAAERGRAATAALALAAAAKPWAVVFVPLAAVAPGRWRAIRPLWAAGLATATWAPFVLAAPATLDTARHAIENDPASVLRALGVDDPVTPPWVRPAQLLGGVAVVALIVARRWWPAALLAGVAWRLLLEPGAHRYYTVGLVLGATLVEVTRRPGRPPWWTLTAAAVLEVTAIPGVPVGPAQSLRLAIVAAALVASAIIDDHGVQRGTTVGPSRWRVPLGAGRRGGRGMRMVGLGLGVVAIVVATLTPAQAQAQESPTVGTTFPDDLPVIEDVSLGTPVLGFGVRRARPADAGHPPSTARQTRGTTTTASASSPIARSASSTAPPTPRYSPP